eukprot:CAMPEP_0172765932 /NCGR_PEP_ID=MMETSP1074-20121228/180239_1 /TAXON_ID=2916 /ORGANISM="Ceratium fusus, Strain PA161109" /LENGTH=42 /DNA_ID= /DNA_START= /DNA_END= /DNA_ORIENTATION=
MADGAQRKETQLVHQVQELLLAHVLLPTCGADPEFVVVHKKV